MPGRILHDQKRVLRVGDVIVAALADRNTLKQIVATEQRLTELHQVGFALQLDAELPAHGTAAAIAADEVVRAQRHITLFGLELCAHRAGVLLEGYELATVTHIDRR